MPLKSLLGWLHRHWFWVMVVLTATTTLVWSLHYYAQAQAQQAPLHWAAALHKGLFAALQFIVLNKELDDALPHWQWAVLSATQLLTPPWSVRGRCCSALPVFLCIKETSPS